MKLKEQLENCYRFLGIEDDETCDNLAEFLIFPDIQIIDKKEITFLAGAEKVNSLIASPLQLPENFISSKSNIKYSPLLYFIFSDLTPSIEGNEQLFKQALRYIQEFVKDIEPELPKNWKNLLLSNRFRTKATLMNRLRQALKNIIKECQDNKLTIPSKLYPSHIESVLPKLELKYYDKLYFRKLSKNYNNSSRDTKDKSDETDGSNKDYSTLNPYDGSVVAPPESDDEEDEKNIDIDLEIYLPPIVKHYRPSFQGDYNLLRELDLSIMPYLMNYIEVKHGAKYREYLEILLILGIHSFKLSHMKYSGRSLFVSLEYNNAKEISRSTLKSIFIRKSKEMQIDLGTDFPDNFAFNVFSKDKNEIIKFCSSNFSCKILKPLFYEVKDSWATYQSPSRKLINAIWKHHYDKLKEFKILQTLKFPPRVTSPGDYYGGIKSNPNCIHLSRLQSISELKHPLIEQLRVLTLAAWRGQDNTKFIRLGNKVIIKEKSYLRLPLVTPDEIGKSENIKVKNKIEEARNTRDTRILIAAIITNWHSLNVNDFVNLLNLSGIAMGHVNDYRERSDINISNIIQRLRQIINSFFLYAKK